MMRRRPPYLTRCRVESISVAEGRMNETRHMT